jgi:hypothetical protein
VLREADPAFVALALDVGFASLSLGMQRIERLLQPFFGGFAGIDRAVNGPLTALRLSVRPGQTRSCRWFIPMRWRHHNPTVYDGSGLRHDGRRVWG